MQARPIPRRWYSGATAISIRYSGRFTGVRKLRSMDHGFLVLRVSVAMIFPARRKMYTCPSRIDQSTPLSDTMGAFSGWPCFVARCRLVTLRMVAMAAASRLAPTINRTLRGRCFMRLPGALDLKLGQRFAQGDVGAQAREGAIEVGFAPPA